MNTIQEQIQAPALRYILKYREQGKRPGTERWAVRKVESVRTAIEWMNQNKASAFLPAFVLTNTWKKDTVAILGNSRQLVCAS